MIDISSLKATAEALKNQYIAEAQAQKPHRINQDYNTEQEQMKQYCGREILELLQNADDARSSRIDISLKTSTLELVITNSGSDTILFTEDGFNSLMYPSTSNKQDSDLPMIGNKGLGFRSVLNWASHIIIDSDNAHVEFSPEYVREFWDSYLAHYISKPLRLANTSEIPLAMLALPKISQLESSQNFTSIKLTIKESLIDKIREELKQFKLYSLLFLHHINEINIDIDGETFTHKNELVSDENGIRISRLDNVEWLCVHQEDSLNTNESQAQRYELAAAICLDKYRTSNEPIYCFFPTRVYFDLPCILHATLELDSSRNSLNEHSRINSEMMLRLSQTIIRLADELKARECSWYPYMLLNPSNSEKAKGYQQQLFSRLSENKGDYIPTLSGKYMTSETCYYFTDEIYDLIDETHKQAIFPNLRLRADAKYRDSRRATIDEIKGLETFANSITDNNTLARLIIAVKNYANSTATTLGLQIFRNKNNQPIHGRTYINEGQKIDFLPAFLDFDYLNPFLQKALEQKMSFVGDERKERQMAKELSSVGAISSSDISSVIQNILPTERDLNKRREEERRELLTCLYKIYLSGQHSLENIASKETPYLMAEDGEWRPANKMVLNDTRFPDGYLNVGIQKIYSAEQCVAYPDFLESVEGSSAHSIQEFVLKFSTQKYILTESCHFGDDPNYLEKLNIPPEIKCNCNSGKDYKRLNTARVAVEGTIDTLELNDLIKLLNRMPEYMSAQQEIHWYLNTYKTPAKISLNYATFKLKQHPAVAPLQYYAVYDREWLPGKQPEGVKFTDNEETDTLLLKLGAARNWDDFSADILYEAINSHTEQRINSHNESGIKSFYHKVKQALVSKNAFPPSNLTMFCRIGSTLTTRKTSEIYYSDNIGVKELRNKLPMLELQFRDGEEQVKRCFGCQLIKDLRAVADDISLHRNSDLEEDLADKLESLKPYILAFATRNAGSRGGDNTKLFAEAKSLINATSVRVVSNASYHYEGADKNLNASITMAEGDLIDFDGELTLCSHYRSIREAISDPRFVNAIVEAICIKLKLNSAENIDRFYRLLKADSRELDFMVQNDFDSNFWTECQEAFGVSDSEVEFWQNVFHTNGIDDFNIEDLKTNKLEYLTLKLKINRQLTERQNFIQSHIDNIKTQYIKYFGPYLHHIHSHLSQKSDEEQATYYRQQENFKRTDWCISAAQDIQYFLNPNYQTIVARYVKDKYDFELQQNAKDIVAPQEHMEYLQGHSEFDFNLSEKDRSWLYFDGKEEYFKDLVSKLNASVQMADADTSIDQSSSIKPAKIIEVTPSQQMLSKSIRNCGVNEPTNSQVKVSERKKQILGNNAEDVVYESLINNEHYDVGTVYSKHLCQKYYLSTADNGIGYDLEYRRKGESLWRYLEIKHSNGQSIIMSDNEFQNANKLPRYDIALVVNGEIRIWRNALSDRENFTDKIGDHILTFHLKEVVEEDGNDACS